MRKRDLLARIEELERRLAEVAPIYVTPRTMYPYAWHGIVPPPSWGTCGTVSPPLDGITATNAPTPNITYTGSPC